MHLVSPALPVGAYAYSQGQEYAVDARWVNSGEELKVWVSGVLRYGLTQLDLPVLQRLYSAWSEQDIDKVQYWNDLIRANRETSELLLEDEQLGVALQRLLSSLNISGANTDLDAPVSFVTMFSLAGFQWHIPIHELMYGFVWSWLENQIAAATKTIPLGQTEAQRLLVELADIIPTAVETAKTIADEDIGLGLPGLAMASALHERQYSRLFRS